MTPTRCAVAVLLIATAHLDAQQPVERHQALAPGAGIKVFLPAGSVRLIGWNRDSLVVRGTVAPGSQFYFGGLPGGVKLGVDLGPDTSHAAASRFEIYVPKTSLVSIKTVSADVEAVDVSGWFYGVSSRLRLTGVARSIEAETISGELTIAATAPWVRARTGSGRLIVAGQAGDVSATSVDGAIELSSEGIGRGRISSVTGMVHFSGDAGTEGIVDIDSYSGPVDVGLRPTMGGECDVTTVAGSIASDFQTVRPVSGPSGHGQQLALAIGQGNARITVRTLRGNVHIHRAL
jgi:hypothetical protein